MNAEYSGIDGFLGTRASLALDLLVVAMLFVLVVLGWSIYQVKYRRRYQLHKWVQVGLAVVLLAAVIGFEIDIRLHGWEDRAAGQVGGKVGPLVWTCLSIHLVFAVSSVVLWPVVVVRALRNFPTPPIPSAHSAAHVRWARWAAIDMVLTAISGWVFYAVAFW